MGQTWDIVCDDCRVRLWVAQDMASNSGKASFYFYGGNRATPDRGEEHYGPLAEFLFDHQDHSLRFLSDSTEDDRATNYLALKGKPGLPVSDEQMSWVSNPDGESY